MIQIKHSFLLNFFLFGFFLRMEVNAQVSLPGIDVQHYSFSIDLNDENDTIAGQAIVRIKFIQNVKSFSLNLVKRNSEGLGMLVTSVKLDNKDISFSQDSDLLHINAKAEQNSIHNYTIAYSGKPADGLIISKNEFGHRTFFGDNWPNRAHNWLPCADYPADKASVEFLVTAPDHYDVVANGLKKEEKQLPNHLKFTHWKETAQLSTKIMVIGVADFAIAHSGDVGNIPVYTYVFPESKKVGFKSYAVAKDILSYYNKQLGPYAYGKLANVQSKTIYGGMENAGAIFYFENSVTSDGIEELMAHEIAHQWFGDAASETNFSHVWLSEGFATYMTNLYLENKYGTDTLKKRLRKDRAEIFAFEKRRFKPIVDTSAGTNYKVLLNTNSYQKGGWVLHMLRRKLGDTVFWKGLRAYYAKYNGENANTDGLRSVMEQTSGQNLKPFFKEWLYTAGHPQLKIFWQYDELKKELSFDILQKQNTVFNFPLEVSIDGAVQTIFVKQKTSTITFPAKIKPQQVKFDPNVNLLAGFEIIEGI